MTQWKYMNGGQQYGPVDTDAIISLLRSGTLKPDTQVMKEGGLNWAPASAFPEFASATAPTPPSTAPGTVPPVAGGIDPSDTSDIDKNKIFAILAYLGILFLVPLLAAKDSKFARFHTNQGFVLFLTALAAWVMALVLSFIPILNCLVHLAVFICILTLMIMGIINAASGKYKQLPLIGHFSIIK
jgi:uncharacterized membrane protein